MHHVSQFTTLLTFEELHEVQQCVVAARAGGELTHALHHFFGILRHVPQLEHVLWSKTAQSCSQRSKSLHCCCFGGQIKKTPPITTCLPVSILYQKSLSSHGYNDGETI